MCDLKNLPELKVSPEGRRRVVDRRALWHSYSRNSLPCSSTEGQVLLEFMQNWRVFFAEKQIIEQFDFSFQYAPQRVCEQQKGKDHLDMLSKDRANDLRGRIGSPS
jgi:hypothetical protein